MAFDLGELLKDVSKSDTGREQIEYIKLSLIDGDKQNFYELSEIEGLANNIATIGLQQPLRIRIHPDKEGRFKTVSGHRRRAALLLLAKEDPERWAEVACIVDRDNVSPALQQLRLIFGNSNTRKMSSADLSEQAAQVEKLLYQLKEEGYEFPGRMRDHVAQVVQASQTKLARLKMIRDNLAPCWKASFKKNDLSESTAYELARLPAEDQQCIFDAKKETGANIRWLYADDVKEYAKRLNAIKKLKCTQFEKGPCCNAERKRLQTVKKERYDNSPCSKCCSVCENLASCKNACPNLADRVRQIEADKKEANRQAKLAQEEKDRPALEFIRKAYARVGALRKEKGMSVKALYDACKRYYWSEKDEEQKELEAGTAKISPCTVLPYGRSFYFGDAESICGIADALDCSVDYLLCRTDIREMVQAAPQEPSVKTNSGSSIEIIPGAWYPASLEPPVGAEIIMVDQYGCVSDDKYLGCGLVKDATCMEWNEAILWALLPKKATAEKLPDAFLPGNTPVTWLAGEKKPTYHLRALARFDMRDSYPPVEVTAYWRGMGWEHRDGLAIDGQCLGWFPLPAEAKKTDDPLNKQCVTGLNPTGHCGSAAFCSEPYACCKDCPDPCNSCCGYLEDAE